MRHSQECLLCVNWAFIRLLAQLSFRKILHTCIFSIVLFVWTELGLDCRHSPIVLHLILLQQCIFSVYRTFIRLLTHYSFIKIWHNFSNACFVWNYIELDCRHSPIVLYLILLQHCLLCVNWTLIRLLTHLSWTWIRLLIESDCYTFDKVSTMTALCEFDLD